MFYSVLSSLKFVCRSISSNSPKHLCAATTGFKNCQFLCHSKMSSFERPDKIRLSNSKMESILDKVVIDGVSYCKVKEGQAEILFPTTQGVFYNPVQEFNRDLSVSIIRTFAAEYERKEKKKSKRSLHSEAQTQSSSADQPSDVDKENLSNPPAEKGSKEGLRILESLGASGLRSIRYAKEIEGVKEIIANDFSHLAVECMKRNIKYNDLGAIITPSEQDASLLHYMNRTDSTQFDVLDLDPYGSPSTFLDGAVQAVSDGGLLLVTSTDMGVLCGNSPETSYAKYGSTSVKGKFCHEFALRIVLQSIESHANRYGRYIKPLLSISADFYIRVAVRVFQSQQKVKESYTKVGYVNHCVGCDVLTPQPIGKIYKENRSVRHRLASIVSSNTCPHCESRLELAGPIWLDPIHDYDFLRKLLVNVKAPEEEMDDGSELCGLQPLGTQRRLEGTISMMLEELEDVPLYYVFDALCGVVGIMPCKMEVFASAILNAGYRYSMSHCKKNSIKTDAPASVVWDILRAREALFPAHNMRQLENAPGFIILSKESKTEVDFTIHPNAKPESKKKELLRFQINPEKYWGPLTRSTTKVLGDTQQQEKRIKNQGRKSHKRDKTPSALKSEDEEHGIKRHRLHDE